MKNKLYIIPDSDNIHKSVELSERWGLNFEYNDFFDPAVLDDNLELKRRIELYKYLGRERGRDTLHGVFYDMCVNSSDNRIASVTRDRMRSSMEVASILGCKGVIFHTNLIPGFEVPFYLDGWLEKNAQFYKKLLSEYPDVEIYLENMFDYKPEMLIRMCEAMKDEERFGICLDIAHAYISKTPLEDWIDALAPYICHFHINDNDGINDLHAAVGDGVIDWEKTTGLIEQVNQDASVLIEVKGIDSQIASLEYLKNKKYI